MTLPFTNDQFFDGLARYNDAVWPAQALLLALALSATGLVVAGRARNALVSSVLALLWAWMAIAYHFAFFTVINPAAWLFGLAFLGASLLFAVTGLTGSLHFDRPKGVAGVAGTVLLSYAILGYPLVGWAVGHAFPRVPTFGLPCPTTIFTLGLLLFARRPVPKAVFVVPLAWSLIGTFAAVRFGVVQDYGLLVSAVVTGVVLATRGPRMSSRQRLLAAVLPRWFLRELERTLAAQKRPLRRTELSALRFEAFDTLLAQPPAFREPSSVAWLSLATTVLAAHRALGRAGLPPSEVRALMAEALYAPMRRHARRYLTMRLGVVPEHPSATLEAIAAHFVHRGRESFGRGWSFEEVVRTADRYEAAVTRCLFASFFSGAKAPELTSLLCGLDDVWGDELASGRYGVVFERRGTLATGAAACDFGFRRTSSAGKHALPLA